MKNIPLLLLLGLLFSSCADNSKPPQHEAAIIGLSLTGHQKIFGSMRLKTITFTEKTGKKIELSRKDALIPLLTGMNETGFLLSENDLKLSTFKSVTLTLSFEDSPKPFLLEAGEQYPLALVDSLNQAIPDNAKTQAVTIDLTRHQGHFLNLQFDLDQSFFLSHKDDGNYITLFKPVIRASSEPVSLTSFFLLKNVEDKAIALSNLLDQSSQTLNLTTSSKLYINQLLYNAKEGLALMKALPSGLLQIVRGPQGKTKLIYQQGELSIPRAWVVKQTQSQTWLAGLFFEKASKRLDLDLKSLIHKSALYFATPKDKIIETSLSKALIGQRVSGVLSSENPILESAPGVLHALINDQHSQLLESISLNGFIPPANTNQLTLLNDLGSLNSNELHAFLVKGVKGSLYATKRQVINPGLSQISLVLPPSLSEFPITEITEDTWTLAETIQPPIKMTQRILGTQVVPNKLIQTIDTSNATFNVYIDRVSGSNRFYSKNNLDDFHRELQVRIAAGYHINELHLQGIQDGHALNARHVNVTLYGSSIQDTQLTEELIEEQTYLESEGFDEGDGEENEEDSNKANAPLIVGLGVGTIAFIGVGLIVKKAFWDSMNESAAEIGGSRKQAEQTIKPTPIDEGISIKPLPKDTSKPNTPDTPSETPNLPNTPNTKEPAQPDNQSPTPPPKPEIKPSKAPSPISTDNKKPPSLPKDYVMVDTPLPDETVPKPWSKKPKPSASTLSFRALFSKKEEQVPAQPVEGTFDIIDMDSDETSKAKINERLEISENYDPVDENDIFKASKTQETAFQSTIDEYDTIEVAKEDTTPDQNKPVITIDGDTSDFVVISKEILTEAHGQRQTDNQQPTSTNGSQSLVTTETINKEYVVIEEDAPTTQPTINDDEFVDLTLSKKGISEYKSLEELLENKTLADISRETGIASHELQPLLIRKKKGQFQTAADYDAKQFELSSEGLMIRFVESLRQQNKQVFLYDTEQKGTATSGDDQNKLNSIRANDKDATVNFASFAESFKSQPNKMYALIPVLSADQKHWSALVLEKDSNNVLAYHIDLQESPNAFKKFFSAEKSTYEVIEIITEHYFKAKPIPLHPKLDKNQSSFGPAAMISGAALITDIANNSARDRFDPNQLFNEIKADLNKIDGQQTARLKFLQMLAPHNLDISTDTVRGKRPSKR